MKPSGVALVFEMSEDVAGSLNAKDAEVHAKGAKEFPLRYFAMTFASFALKFSL